MTKLQSSTRRLLRLKLASQYVSLSPWKLRKLVQDGQLPVIKYGENAPWLFDVRDLDGWIESHKQTI